MACCSTILNCNYTRFLLPQLFYRPPLQHLPYRLPPQQIFKNLAAINLPGVPPIDPRRRRHISGLRFWTARSIWRSSVSRFKCTICSPCGDNAMDLFCRVDVLGLQRMQWSLVVSQISVTRASKAIQDACKSWNPTLKMLEMKTCLTQNHSRRVQLFWVCPLKAGSDMEDWSSLPPPRSFYEVCQQPVNNGGRGELDQEYTLEENGVLSPGVKEEIVKNKEGDIAFTRKTSGKSSMNSNGLTLSWLDSIGGAIGQLLRAKCSCIGSNLFQFFYFQGHILKDDYCRGNGSVPSDTNKPGIFRKIFMYVGKRNRALNSCSKEVPRDNFRQNNNEEEMYLGCPIISEDTHLRLFLLAD